MDFTTIPCHEVLRPFIRDYWLLTAYCTARGIQQVFSNGAASLHFYITQDVALDGSEKMYHTALNRHDLGRMEITVEKGELVIFGVEFVPFCSRMFFRSDFDMAHIAPSDLMDDEFEVLSRMVHGADGAESRAKLLDSFFLKRLSEVQLDKMNLERMNDVFDEIVPTDGTMPSPPHSKEKLSPADLASLAHIGQKQFTRVFNKYVGMNPKTYLRLLRFHKALMALQKTDAGQSLTETSWLCGYYDLSHMISDFRAICGYSPTELLNKHNLTEAFQPEFGSMMKKKIKIENLI